jgi:hypothetical protein
VSWDNPADRVVVEPEFLKEMEDQMIKIKQNLKVARTGRNVMLIRTEPTEISKWVIMFS